MYFFIFIFFAWHWDSSAIAGVLAVLVIAETRFLLLSAIKLTRRNLRDVVTFELMKM